MAMYNSYRNGICLGPFGNVRHETLPPYKSIIRIVQPSAKRVFIRPGGVIHVIAAGVHFLGLIKTNTLGRLAQHPKNPARICTHYGRDIFSYPDAAPQPMVGISPFVFFCLVLCRTKQLPSTDRVALVYRGNDVLVFFGAVPLWAVCAPIVKFI